MVVYFNRKRNFETNHIDGMEKGGKGEERREKKNRKCGIFFHIFLSSDLYCIPQIWYIDSVLHAIAH